MAPASATERSHVWGPLVLPGSPPSLSCDDSPAAVPAASVEGPSGEARFGWEGAAQRCFSREPGSKEASAPPQERGRRTAPSGSEC